MELEVRYGEEDRHRFLGDKRRGRERGRWRERLWGGGHAERL